MRSNRGIPPRSRTILVMSINGNKVGIIVLNHKRSPDFAPSTQMSGKSRRRIRKKKAAGRTFFIGTPRAAQAIYVILCRLEEGYDYISFSDGRTGK